MLRKVGSIVAMGAVVRSTVITTSTENESENDDEDPKFPRFYKVLPEFMYMPTKYERYILIGLLVHAQLTLTKIFFGWRYKTLAITPLVITIANYMKDIDDNQDYENWLKCESSRDRGLPRGLWPYKVRHDWTEYDMLKYNWDVTRAKYLRRKE